MTFNYFDPTNQHWWVNRIQANGDGSYVIKNIAAKHPDKVLEKVYHNRRLNLFDLNPNAMSIINLPSDQGRFVKGKIVRAECFTDEKPIQVIKDGRAGSKVGFIHIAVPEILLDSVSTYAEDLKNNLAKAAFLNARLYNANNIEDNISAAFRAFRGKYVSEDSTAFIDFEVVNVGLVRFIYKKENRVSYGTIGYDVDRNVVFVFLAGNKDYVHNDFTFNEATRELILENESSSVHVIGRNTIQWDIKGLKGKFVRY